MMLAKISTELAEKKQQQQQKKKHRWLEEV